MLRNFLPEADPPADNLL